MALSFAVGLLGAVVNVFSHLPKCPSLPEKKDIHFHQNAYQSRKALYFGKLLNHITEI